MAIRLAAHHHVNLPDPHRLWNPLFHSRQDLFPLSSNVTDDLQDTKPNNFQKYDLAYGNECKTISSSFQHGFHYPMDLWFSGSFALKFSCAWLSSSNILKHYRYSNHKRNIQTFPKSYVRIFHVYHNQNKLY